MNEYIKQLRSDERFIDALKQIEIPQVPSFRPDSSVSEKDWIRGSGRRDGVLAVLAELSGLNPEEF
jgi:hypothetical protein